MSLSTQLSLPDSSLFILPPAIDPITPLAPAAGTWSQNSPLFTIPESLYHGVFDARVPITIAATYAISVQLLNAYNKSNGNKPWAISKTRVFYWLVIAHNVFLAVYSLWTCVGMFNAISRTLISPFGPDGLTGTVDLPQQVLRGFGYCYHTGKGKEIQHTADLPSRWGYDEHVGWNEIC
jgi:hypothetical protein